MTAGWRLHPHAAPHLRPLADAARTLPLARKDAALLTYVALTGGAPSAHVALLLWPGGGDARPALNSLRQRLHRLRRATGARLLEVADTARLAADLSIEPPGDDPAGELLGAYDYADAPDFAIWLEAERRSRAAARCQVLADAAAAAERDGALATALVHAQRLLAGDALSEHAHRRLMRLHYRRGDIAAAVAAFEACERTLKEELGLQPSAETLELLRTIESSRGAAPLPAVALPTPASLLRPPRTVGRARERSLLATAHADGRIATLVGEAGMGKTRLLQDLVAATAPAAVYAQARPGDAAVPYGALARLLRAVVAADPALLDQAPRSALAQVAPEFGASDAAAATTTRLQPAIERLLAAAVARQPRQTFVVDDLHFADPASVEMLRALVDADALADARWVFAHRPLGAADDALLQSLADAPRACWITLSALGDADLVELLDSLALPGVDAAALGPALARHTGGNPLYVLETLRTGHAALRGVATADATSLPSPHSIAHLIDRRLQRLSPTALALGRVAALAGPDFSPDLAEHALATPALLLAGAWAELEAADVLRGNAFAHDLVRDAMLRATPQAIAVHAHRLIAQHLSAQAAAPARTAAHWLAAAAFEPAAAAWRDAAMHAARAGRPREHAALLQQAADADARAGQHARAVETRSRALLPLLYGDGLSAAQALSDAMLAADATGPSAGLVWTRRASLLMHAGQAAAAETAARKALELLRDADEHLRIEACTALAIACLARGAAAEGLALIRPWADAIDAIADPQLRLQFCSARAVLLNHLDRIDEAAQALAQQIDIAVATGQQGELVPALLSSAFLQLRRGAADIALRHAGDAAAAQAGDEQAGLIAGNTRALLGSGLGALGRYQEAIAQLEQACSILEQAGRDTRVHCNCESALAEVLLQIGQTARAARLVARDTACADASVAVRRLLVRAAIARAAGRRDDAVLAQLQQRAPDASGLWQMLAGIEAARSLAPPAAADACSAVLARSRRSGDQVVTVLAAALRLDAWCTAGAAAEAAAAAFELEQMARHCRATALYPPAVWLACHRGYLANREHAAAARVLAAARDWVRQVALPNLPDAFRDAFLNRHAGNRALQQPA